MPTLRKSDRAFRPNRMDTGDRGSAEFVDPTACGTYASRFQDAKRNRRHCKEVNRDKIRRIIRVMAGECQAPRHAKSTVSTGRELWRRTGSRRPGETSFVRTAGVRYPCLVGSRADARKGEPHDEKHPLSGPGGGTCQYPGGGSDGSVLQEERTAHSG